MIYLLKLELTKIRRSRYTYILMLLLLIAVGSYFFYEHKKEMNLKEAEAYMLSILEEFQTWYDETKLEVEEAEAEGNVGYALENYMKVAEKSVRSTEKQYKGIVERDWSLYWQGRIMEREPDPAVIASKAEYGYMYETLFNILSEADRKKWMEERAIQPILMHNKNEGAWLTLYDEEFDDPLTEEITLNLSEKHSSSGFYFVYKVFSYGFGLAGLLFLLFLFADILTKEGFGRNGPIRLLRTQPIKRTNFWISKGITVMGGSLLIILLITVVGLGLGSLFNRLGDWDYPILIYGPDRTYTFLPIAEFLGKGLGLFLLVLALSFSLIFLFSLLTNRAILAIGLTIIVIIIGKILTEQSLLLTWSHWIPFHYIEVYPILNGEYAVINKNNLFTYRQAILSLSISIVILITATFTVARLRKGVMS